jgi:ribosomal protein S18 acetylase RimI-like enzyme
MPTGYAKLKLPSGHKVPGNEGAAQLQKIYVLAEFKANRLGHALMQAVMAQAAGGGASTIWLTVLDTNEPAIRFYRRCGWRDAGTATFTIGSLRFSYLVLDCDVVCSVP